MYVALTRIERDEADFLTQVDELQNGKVSLGLSIVVRITLKDGTYHEVNEAWFRGSPVTDRRVGHWLRFHRERQRQSSILRKGKEGGSYRRFKASAAYFW